MTIRELLAAQLERHHLELAAYYRRFYDGTKRVHTSRKPRQSRYVRELWAEIDSLTWRLR